MKKFLFSAVALVAFSFAGIANNEAKEVESKELKKEIKESRKDVGDCDAYKTIVYIGAVGAGFSHEVASGMSYEFYFGCLANTISDSPFE